LRFTWDKRKAVANLSKHGVSFEEALTVFTDPLARIFPDEEHSSDEPREIMKKRSDHNETRERSYELRPEYRFDYSKAKPNRFAKRMSAEAIAVVLDPDVAAVFKSSKAVNKLLRSVIEALPNPSER
jgi:uncharacterized protein